MMDQPSTGEAVPPELREAVRRDFSPVRPLASPWKRALWMSLPAMMSLALAAMLLADRRGAAGVLSASELGVSVTEWLAGLILLWLALRESVPALGLGHARCMLVIAGGIAVELVLGIWVWHLAAVGTMAANAASAGAKCATVEGLIGLPHVAVALWLGLRALPLRPGCSGALAGSAAGLLADSVWHLACGRDDLEHLLVWHLGAVVAMTLVGAVTGSLWSRRLWSPFSNQQGGRGGQGKSGY